MSRASARKINYSLRPAKNIERKMLGEVFARLLPIAPPSAYRYVGFGSPFFNDFSLFHETLGISSMVSMERRDGLRKRCEFNRPYGCIELEYGDSNHILPKLSWAARSIVWLDYESALSSAILQDIETVCSKAKSGSFLAISMNVAPPAPPRFDEAGVPLPFQDIHDYRRQSLVEAVGENRVRSELDGKDLAEWGLATECYRIVREQIDETLRICNGASDRRRHREFRQVVRFHYSDNARMLTVGGVILDEGDAHRLGDGAFADLPFAVPTSGAAILLDPPVLTGREVRFLNRHLPTIEADVPAVDWLSLNERKRYMAVYRYFPVFAESEL